MGRSESENEADGTGSAPWSWDSRSALAEKVEFLRRPESFSEGTTGVEAVETHMSWVFLTDEYAYKLKKPVRFELLNLSTLEDRRRNCDAEVRWNRRLRRMFTSPWCRSAWTRRDASRSEGRRGSWTGS